MRDACFGIFLGNKRLEITYCIISTYVRIKTLRETNFIVTFPPQKYLIHVIYDEQCTQTMHVISTNIYINKIKIKSCIGTCAHAIMW